MSVAGVMKCPSGSLSGILRCRRGTVHSALSSRPAIYTVFLSGTVYAFDGAVRTLHLIRDDGRPACRDGRRCRPRSRTRSG